MARVASQPFVTVMALPEIMSTGILVKTAGLMPTPFYPGSLSAQLVRTDPTE
jgi:hypothetical protein